jgi:uncharacterized membrane protein
MMIQNPSSKIQAAQRHYAALALVVLVGFSLRLWHLDTKPLWLDEVLTALFTTGHSYQDVPLNSFFSLTALDSIFQFRPGLSCSEIARRVMTESVHPPVFFCLLYGWLDWLRPTIHWVWALRLLPALFGVAAIGAVYWLNRLAFTPKAGLLAAALMSVSPFAVYLSQEARHYTLPMLIVTLTLALLVQMQQDLIWQKRFRWAVWLSWSLLNILGLYTHYFCILALVAQIVALTGWMLWYRCSMRDWLAWGLAVAAVGLSYLPWLPIAISHFSRPETNWLIPYKPDWTDRLEPLYQMLAGWTVMLIALPVEGQPRQVSIVVSLLMLGFMLWLAWQLKTGVRQLWRSLPQYPALWLLVGFTVCILLQFLAIIYLLNKDLTVVPRYNFIYYPAVCALLGAVLASQAANQTANQITIDKQRKIVLPLLLVGLLSSVLVVNDFAFQKSYHPDRVAQWMAFEPERPLAVVVSYESAQEVALGLSFALELRQFYSPKTVDRQVRFAFLDRSQGYRESWEQLGSFALPLSPPLNLWAVASPGMRTGDYPSRLRLNALPTLQNPMRCKVDPEEFHRLGFPYQLYRCQLVRQRQ